MPASNSVTAVLSATTGALGFAAGAALAGPDLPPPLMPAAFSDGGPIVPTKSEVQLDHELCNGLDDDWDGAADEGFTVLGMACDGPDADAAKCGRYACRADELGVECAETDVPREEWCNGRDDDCDGATDEGYHVGDGCSVGLGVCRRMAVWRCDADDPKMAVCLATPGAPSPEVCNNNLDDDCDGLPDRVDPDCRRDGGK